MNLTNKMKRDYQDNQNYYNKYNKYNRVNKRVINKDLLYKKEYRGDCLRDSSIIFK